MPPDPEAGRPHGAASHLGPDLERWDQQRSFSNPILRTASRSHQLACLRGRLANGLEGLIAGSQKLASIAEDPAAAMIAREIADGIIARTNAIGRPRA